MDSATPQHFEFRGFRLDRRSRSLTHPNGSIISLNAKAFDTLVVFLEHPGRVLDRDTLLETVWPGVVVEENNLSQAVAALRRVLGDGFIATVTGRGYQFVAEVHVLPQALQEQRARSKRIFGAVTLFVLALAGVALIILVPRSSTESHDNRVSPNERSIAVLPFDNESAAEENAAFFANGIQDELLTRLSKVRDLKVTSRTSVDAYRDSGKSLRQIGSELGVANVVEGRVQRSADRVRISVQLIDVETDKHLWAQTYDRELSAENIFAIQSDMATSIASSLQAALSDEELSLLEDVPTQSTRAYDFYLTGIHYFRNRTDPLNFIPLAMQSFERAVEEDPEFAWGWAMLSVLHSEMYWFYFDRSEARLKQAEHAARVALELAPDVPEMHFAMALYHYRRALDYDAALAELAVAEQRCPACTEVLSLRGSLNRRRGRFDASMEDFDRIVERDPRNIFQLSAHHLVNYEYLRDYERAAETVERILELAPDDASALHEEALIPMLRDGDPTRLLDYARNPPTPDYLADPTVRVDLWRAAMYARDYDRAVELIQSSDAPTHPLIPVRLYAGVAHLFADRQELAVTELEATRADIERHLEKTGDDPPTEAHWQILYGYTLAGLGAREAAIEASRRARRLLPKTKDALSGAWIQYNAIHVLALAGDEASALDELEDYLEGYGPWSIDGLRPDPGLDPIREHPRFAALVKR